MFESIKRIFANAKKIEKLEKKLKEEKWYRKDFENLKNDLDYKVWDTVLYNLEHWKLLSEWVIQSMYSSTAKQKVILVKVRGWIIWINLDLEWTLVLNKEIKKKRIKT